MLRRERPDALLATMGGGTALNLARELQQAGILDELGIELIGAKIDAIQRAEDRELFKSTVEGCGLRVPTSRIVTSIDDLAGISLPAVVRPAFTLGGHGGGFADTPEQLRAQVERGLSESPISQVLVEESVRGWDEFELEVVRDHADNVVIVCSIENLDPMGVHTGDSVTVAPQMTLSDEAYQELRDAAISVIRAVGVDTGGSNIQFARDRVSGDIRVIEMNPRVSRSSALASKATGYPIAKVAAKLAVGYTLDEIPNDLTGTTPASFEPTLDYVVVKIPRFAFEKFPNADTTLGTQMKSVGETMGIGRSFIEAFVKAKRGLEGDFEWQPENLHPWFRRELEGLAAEEDRQRTLPPVYRRIDSVAGEVEAPSNYYYATWGEQDEGAPQGDRQARRDSRVGAEPDRARGGVRLLLRARRPDLSRARLRGGDGQLQPGDGVDRLRHVQPPVLRAARRGIGAGDLRARAARGRRDPVRRADAAQARARDRGGGLRDPRHALRRGRSRRGSTSDSASSSASSASAARTGGSRAPASRPPRRRAGSAIRCSCGPRTCSGAGRCASATREEQVVEAFHGVHGPTLVDRFLEYAIEIDVDALCDGETTYVGAIMQHVEEAGVHSGDSACVLPAQSLGVAASAEISSIVKRLGPALGRRRAPERPARGRRRRGVRARGQSARVADRAVRVEGHRRQPRRRGLPARRRTRSSQTSTCRPSARRARSA